MWAQRDQVTRLPLARSMYRLHICAVRALPSALDGENWSLRPRSPCIQLSPAGGVCTEANLSRHMYDVGLLSAATVYYHSRSTFPLDE